MPFKEAKGATQNNEGDIVPAIRTTIPWAGEKTASYVYYECTVGVMLDSGIVVHNRLPQVDNEFDTLSSAKLDDPNLAQIVGAGVNLKCKDQYTDIVQRMAHSRYLFCLYGQALRIGYQVPIPGIKYIGGVPAIPYDKNPQLACNRPAPGGNYGGVILWHAYWTLWYTTATQPNNNTIPLADPTVFGTKLDGIPPNSLQVPIALPDDNYTPSASNDIDVGLFIKGQGS